MSETRKSLMKSIKISADQLSVLSSYPPRTIVGRVTEISICGVAEGKRPRSLFTQGKRVAKSVFLDFEHAAGRESAGAGLVDRTGGAVWTTSSQAERPDLIAEELRQRPQRA